MGSVTISTPTRRTACSISDDVIAPSFLDNSSTTLSRKKNLITLRIVPNKMRDKKAVTPCLSFNCSKKFFPIPSKVSSSWSRGMFLLNRGIFSTTPCFCNFFASGLNDTGNQSIENTKPSIPAERQNQDC